MNKKNFVFATILTAAWALAITACGDDVTEVTEVHKDGMAVLKAGEKLSKQACDTTNVGEMLFVTDSSAAFVCNGESWLTLEGDKGETGAQGEAGEKGEKGDTGKAGDKGERGDKGDQGETGEKGAKGDEGAAGDQGPVGATGAAGAAGASCSVADTTDAETNLKGFKLICADTLAGVVWNGEKGAAGNAAGPRGADCVAEDDGNGKVTVTCGEASSSILYKAVCGMNPYDPAKAFCTEGEVYDLCGGKAYDPAKSFCTEGEVYDLCVGKVYDPKKSFCSEGELFSCGGKPHDPAKAFCTEGELFSCDGKPYDPAKSFCSDSELYDLCGEKAYDPKKQFCDIRDYQIYGYVTIAVGDYAETWMAENLNYSVNPKVQSWCGGGSGSKEGDCSVYGRLYTWAAAMDSAAAFSVDGKDCGYKKACNLPSGDVRGVCPENWHLPDTTEWRKLLDAVGGTDIAGKKLKANSELWKSEGGLPNDDSFGFSVLPAGFRDGNNGGFGYVAQSARFWSSTENSDPTKANYRYFNYNFDNVSFNWGDKRNAYSVRCVKDN